MDSTTSGISKLNSIPSSIHNISDNFIIFPNPSNGELYVIQIN